MYVHNLLILVLQVRAPSMMALCVWTLMNVWIASACGRMRQETTFLRLFKQHRVKTPLAGIQTGMIRMYVTVNSRVEISSWCCTNLHAPSLFLREATANLEESNVDRISAYVRMSGPFYLWIVCTAGHSNVLAIEAMPWWKGARVYAQMVCLPAQRLWLPFIL